MKLLIPIFAVLCLWLRVASGVIQQGYVRWDTNGAVSYSLWAWPLGATDYQLLAVTNKPPLPVANVQDGTRLYLKGNYLLDSGQCCKESDLGFIITPPQTNNPAGTNNLRIVGPVNALQLQASGFGPVQWTNVATFTGGPPAQLPLLPGASFFRTTRTNLPPMPPQ